MAELAEGARLLSEYGAKVPSRVRIPLSPPVTIIEPVSGFGKPALFLTKAPGNEMFTSAVLNLFGCNMLSLNPGFNRGPVMGSR